jgi:DNA-directed RNA polymerase beta subunit
MKIKFNFQIFFKMSNLSEENIWKILETYYQTNGLVLSQIESYNDFITFGLQEIIDQESVISTPNYIVKFGQISLAEPHVIEEDRTMKKIYPGDARKRDLNYDTAIYCDISETFIEQEKKYEKIHRRIVIGRLPVMLKSCVCNLSRINSDRQIEEGECPNDPGGYFIIKGNERVLVAQMRNNYNQVFVLKQKPGDRYTYIAETRSMSSETGHSVLVKAMISTDDRSIFFSLPYVKEPIPVGIVFKALGFTEEIDISNFIGIDNEQFRKYIRYIIRDSFICQTREEALDYIGERALHIIQKDREKHYGEQIIHNELFPHLGVSASSKEYACFLGHILRKLLSTILGLRMEDDRDNYANKRIEVAGTLLYDIFRNLFKKYVQFIKTQLIKKKQRPDILSIISRTKNITKGLHQCMSTGNWVVQKNASYMKTGVSQVLDRMTYCASLSHLRRILIPVGKEGKNTAIRQIHPSQYGFVCPCECFSPETKILLWNGTIKLAKDIVVGDMLIDDNGNPTRVKNTCSGFNEMYTIQHENKRFEDYTVTSNHILTLKPIVNKLSKFFSSENYYEVISFDEQQLKYIKNIFNNIDEAEKYIKNQTIDISIEKYLSIPEEIRNTLLTFKCKNVNWPETILPQEPYSFGLRVNDKIPSEYLINSRNNRERLLQGLLQNEKYKQSKQVEFLLDSLGYTIRDGYVLQEDEICSKFSLFKKELQPFVGWQLEGNGRFLLHDFTVTHNTPEGGKVGIVLNFALLSKTTKKNSTVNTRRVIEDCKTITSISKMKIEHIKNYSTVFLNNIIIGFTQDPDTTIENINTLRKIGLIDKEVSVTYDIVDNDVKIFCDEGRFIRPLFTLTDNKLNIQPQEKYNWKMLIKKGLIQYVDVSEIENSVIAMSPKDLESQYNNYCEIHPCVMLGIAAAMIPFSDHSQSPRNCYQSSMSKQALGIPVLSYNVRSDTILHVLHYPQKPLVFTKPAEIFGMNNMPSGINAIVAIACYSGFNQEDSVMLNFSAVQRGLFCLTSYHTIDCIEKKRDTYSLEEICLPPLNSDTNIKEGDSKYFKRKNANYSYLDKYGIIKTRDDKGQPIVVKKGDVIIGKIVITGNKNREQTRTDASVVIDSGEEGTIDRVIVTITPNGYKLVKVIIRVYRSPTIGDKLACYDTETEVLTTNGWISIKDITVEHKVACLIKDTELEYHNPVKIQNYDYKGKMYHVKTDKIDLLVTPNHRMYVGNSIGKDFKMERADEIYGKTSSYKLNIDKWKPKQCLKSFTLQEVGNLPELNIPLKEWCEFFGIWITKGKSDVCFLDNTKSNVLTITDNEKIIDEIYNYVKVLEKYNLKPFKRELNTLYLQDDRLVKYLSSLNTKMVDKYIPKWCFNLNMKYTRYLIQGILLGNKYNGDSMIIYETPSIKLRDDLSILCVHAGWSCNYYLKDLKEDASQYWVLNIYKSQKHVVNRYNNLEKQRDSWVDYDAKVYCCTVPTEKGIIYVRRKGKSVWSGQSRAGQKGTIGMMYMQHDMPFTSSGIVPDIIINPCCIPSRMTINQLIECALGKECTAIGNYADATPFTDNSLNAADKIVERANNSIEKYGFHSQGYETMYNGMTGEMMEAKIFIGPTYYQRLKHMVDDKMHARAKGNVTMLTRQAAEGRSRDGGLRFGEMERDAIISHGASRFLKERLFDVSDAFQMTICSKCGIPAKSTIECQSCKGNDVKSCNIAYASKLLTQELTAMGLKISIFPDEN